MAATVDATLIERLRSGDEQAFDTLFRAWYAPLVRLSTGLVRSRAVAEEIVQDVMLELWRHRDRLNLEGSAEAYLLRSTRNRSLNHLRHERVQDRAAPLLQREFDRPSRPVDRLVGAEVAEAVRIAVDELPARTREVFELSRVHGLKYLEIAESLGISVKTVEAQMGRALRILREQLAPWLPGGESL
jgi:RNA polymerase sigma-70 factor (ECF subfamily)